jgi:hypothetical protein
MKIPRLPKGDFPPVNGPKKAPASGNWLGKGQRNERILPVNAGLLLPPWRLFGTTMETRTLMRPPPASLAALLCLAIPTFAGQVIFHEVMYHPLPGKPEFLEIVNLTSNRIDTANWKLSDGVEYTFPAFNPAAASAHFLNEYERIVLSSDTEAATRAAYPNLPPNVRVLGPWTGSLNNTGETVTLRDFAGALQSTLTYGDNGQWPRAFTANYQSEPQRG